MSQIPQEPPKLPEKFDFRTIHVAAIVAVSQERKHWKESFNLLLAEEARKAHKFVAINCGHIATTILMMIDGNFNNACARKLAIRATIEAEEKAAQTRAKLKVVE